MSDNRIELIHVLAPEEYSEIDRFCAEHQGEASLPACAAFLDERFSLALVLDHDAYEGFVSDSSNLPGRASALCRPCTIREGAIVLRACYTGRIPVTISAGRSNLTGSATPEGGVIVSTVKMTGEPLVNSAHRTVYAEVGTIVEDLRREVTRLSDGALTFPLDPTSRAEATVGGALACNASGFTPGESGSIRHWVQEVTVLLPNGMAVHARRGDYASEQGAFVLDDGERETRMPVPRYPRPTIKNASGPFSSPDGRIDFVDLIVGSEGLFGMVVACTLKLQPSPRAHLDLFVSLPGEQETVALHKHIHERLDRGMETLSALEYFGHNCRTYMKHQGRLFHGDNQVGVYIQVPLGDRSLEDAAEEWFELLIDADCGVDDDAVILIDTPQVWDLLMEARHSLPANALEVVQHHGTYTIMTDALVPPERFSEFLSFSHDAIRPEGLEYVSFGHLGDCHIHFTILPTCEQLAIATAVYERIVDEAGRLGGVYSGEHGTGKRKRRDFLACYGQDAVEQLRATKASIDPDFLLNRNNVFVWHEEKDAIATT